MNQWSFTDEKPLQTHAMSSVKTIFIANPWDKIVYEPRVHRMFPPIRVGQFHATLPYLAVSATVVHDDDVYHDERNSVIYPLHCLSRAVSARRDKKAEVFYIPEAWLEPPTQ